MRVVGAAPIPYPRLTRRQVLQLVRQRARQGHLAGRLEAAGLDAVPVAVVHDEVILETARQDADEAARILEECMVAGMLDVFPDAATDGLVEAGIGRSWADK